MRDYKNFKNENYKLPKKLKWHI